MIKELYQEKSCETTLNVTQSCIDSVREKNIVKSCCRVYDNGFIGIAGCLGEPTEETWNQAIKNLDLKVEYEYEPEKNKARKRDSRNTEITIKIFMDKSKELLEKLRQEFPQFIFSNKIYLLEETDILKNDCNLEYINADSMVLIGLVFKHVDSTGIFDGEVLYYDKDFDVEKILDEARKQLPAFTNNVDLEEEGTMPVVMGFGGISEYFDRALNGEIVGLKSSMFNGKFGTKAFNDDFTLYVDRTTEGQMKCFFDLEGSTIKDDVYNLIDKGNLVTGFCDKRSSHKFNMPNTASAVGDYDDIPTVNGTPLSIKPSDKTFAELLGGKKAILVGVMSGGDITNEGDFATPVQLAYLVENNKIVAKLPELNISGNIFNMFGKDYIGYSKDKPFNNERYLVLNMKVSK